ncbi:MAG: NAD(P)-dependent oxidoreductase [Pseudomonadota bacterium]
MGTIFITGANGFIGRHLVNRLFKTGHKILGVGHGLWPEADAHKAGMAHWINGEIDSANLNQLKRVAGIPDYVIHLAGGSSVGAAISNPGEDFFRTVATSSNLLNWIRGEASETQLLAISSAAIYGGGHKGLINEDVPPKPFSPYGVHKWLMEELCRSYAENYGLRIAIARLFSVYGNGLKKQLLWDSCARLASGLPALDLGGTGSERRDWTDVHDVCCALELLLPQAEAKMPIFNVGTGKGITVREIAIALTQAYHPGIATPITFSGQSRPGDPFSLVADSSLLNKLGFTWSIDWQDGITDYVMWFKQQGATARQ